MCFCSDLFLLITEQRFDTGKNGRRALCNTRRAYAMQAALIAIAPARKAVLDTARHGELTGRRIDDVYLRCA